MGEKKIAAVCLAAGQGKRMESKVQKQYLLIENKPVLYYALKAFQESPVEEVVLVVGTGEEQYCQKEIVDHFGFSKVKAIVVTIKVGKTIDVGFLSPFAAKIAITVAGTS